MKKYFASGIVALVVILFALGCSKKAQVVSLNSYNVSSTALLPLRVGNEWYYKDSTYDTTNTLKSAVLDTAQVQNQSVSFSNGVPFWQVTETDTSSYSFFGNIFYTNYTDQRNNLNIYATDTSTTLYFIWGTPTGDGAQLTPTYTDLSNLSCVKIESSYGFTTNYTINGYNNCYKNIYQQQACNGIKSEVTYVSAGVGVVRYEIWVLFTGSTTPHLVYSQTLTKFIPK